MMEIDDYPCLTVCEHMGWFVECPECNDKPAADPNQMGLFAAETGKEGEK